MYYKAENFHRLLKPSCGGFKLVETIKENSLCNIKIYKTEKIFEHENEYVRFTRNINGRAIAVMDIYVNNETVSSVYVMKKFRRRGHATFLFKIARLMWPALKVNMALSEAGTGWVKSLKLL